MFGRLCKLGEVAKRQTLLRATKGQEVLESHECSHTEGTQHRNRSSKLSAYNDSQWRNPHIWDEKEAGVAQLLAIFLLCVISFQSMDYHGSPQLPVFC